MESPASLPSLPASPIPPSKHNPSGTFNRTPKLTRKQRENQSQLIFKNLNFNLHIKLDDNNFIYWKTQILPVVRAFDLEDFIFGATTCPPKFVSSVDEESGEHIQCYNDDYLVWKKIDQLLTSWLMSTLTESVLGRVTQCITSCEVWLTVTNMFSQQSMARIMHLRSQLQTLKKGSMKISEYILKIKGVADALMAAGQTMTEQDLVAYILGGLGLEFDPIICNIASKKEEITLQDAQFLLMGYESRLEQYHASTTIDISQATANLSAKTANFARGGNQFQNNNRGRSRGGKRGGRGGRYFNQRLVCQLCGKPGHFSGICYHRFDQTFAGTLGKQHQQHPQSVSNYPMQGNFAQQQQMEYPLNSSYPHQSGTTAYFATPTSVGDLSWYMDSGATHHITPDFSNLNINNEYKGNDQLAVGQNYGENTAPRSSEGWPLQSHPSKG
ncbi:hypothetical protein ACOSQ4_030308 [Xanthoceras sorbifolium]